MKRYMLFGSRCYYANGGMHDFVNSFDSEELAKVEGERRNKKEEDYKTRIEWFHIYDMKEKKIIFENGTPHN